MNKQVLLIVIISVIVLGVISVVADHGHFEWNGNFEYYSI